MFKPVSVVTFPFVKDLLRAGRGSNRMDKRLQQLKVCWRLWHQYCETLLTTRLNKKAEKNEDTFRNAPAPTSRSNVLLYKHVLNYPTAERWEDSRNKVFP